MGARVVKTYHQPLTPYERVVSSPHVPQSEKQQLQAIFPRLDPIALLQNIRDVQQELAVGRAAEPGQLSRSSGNYERSGNWVRCGPHIESRSNITGELDRIHLRTCGPQSRNNSNSLPTSHRRNSFGNFKRNIPAIYLMVKSGRCDVESRSGECKWRSALS
jgi:hypothetical protein